VCKAHRLLYHSTLGLRVIKKKKRKKGEPLEVSTHMLYSKIRFLSGQI